MKKYKFYTYSGLILMLLFFGITLIASNYIVKNSFVYSLTNEIQATKNLTQQIARMASNALENEVAPKNILENVQDGIENTLNQNSFISIYDWSGKITAFPDITKLGTQASSDALITNLESTPSGEDLYDLINKSNTKEGIIYQQPVLNSDWIVAGHINLENIKKSQDVFQNKIYVVFFIITLLSILFTLTSMRYISSFLEEQLDQKILKFEDSVLNIEKLNTSLENYQKNLSEINQTSAINTTKTDVDVSQPSTNSQEIPKSRLLTYVRNELVPISTKELAYVYVDNTITYVVRKDGKKATSNESLDQIFSELDTKSFFRVNRQIIVEISSIETITKFGNKLKLQLNPRPEIDVFIGKNKAASFKQWLDL